MKLPKIFASLLPGLFLVGLTVGTGSVTSMVKAGADHGTKLLWALLLSCIVSYVLFDAFGRLTIHSGKTALNAIRTYIHPSIALLLLAALLINVSASVMGVMGIVAGVLSEWSLSWSSLHVNASTWALLLGTIIFIVLLNGTVRALEVLLATLAGIMGICFLINAATMLPPTSEIIKGLIPNIPLGSSESGTGYLVVASMVAGMSSQFPNVVSVSWLIHDYRGEPAKLSGNYDKLLIFCMCLISLIVPFFQRPPVWVMLVSQALGAILLPTTIVCLAYLLNRKDVMGGKVNNISENMVMSLVIMFSFIMAGVGAYGLVS